MNTDHLVETNQDTGEVYDLIQEMGPIINGKNRMLILMACLSIALLVQDPDIEAEALYKGIHSTSQHIALYLSGLKDKVNLKDMN